MRLIDADYQQECLEEFAGSYLVSENPIAVSAGKVMIYVLDKILHAQPTIDPETLPIVQELREKLEQYEQTKRAYWEFREIRNGVRYWTCSNCRNRINTWWAHDRYCSYCGAEMCGQNR